MAGYIISIIPTLLAHNKACVIVFPDSCFVLPQATWRNAAFPNDVVDYVLR